MSPSSSAEHPRLQSASAVVKKSARRVARAALPLVQRAAGSQPVPAKTVPARSGGVPAGGTDAGWKTVARTVTGSPDSRPAEVADVAELARVQARAVQLIAEGHSPAEAFTEVARDLFKSGQVARALAFGHSLNRHRDTERLGRAVLGMCFLKTGTSASAWAAFEPLAGEPEVAGAAQEFYAAAYETLGPEAESYLRRDLDAGNHHAWNTRALLRTAQKAARFGQLSSARELMDAGTERIGKAGFPYYRKEFARLESWLPGGSRTLAPQTTPGAVNFGVISYQQPDNATRNIGDYIQTIASLGHLARQDGFEFVGEPELVGFTRELRSTVKPERRVDGPSATINLFELHRDANTLQDLPEPTWAILFGWYMHDAFGLGYNLPFNPNLRPIPLSVFIRYPEMLTPEAIDYLRRYAPIGCRDWQTVALLTAAGIPAFFSGCLTTTVDTVFRRTGEDTRNARLFVDAPVTGPGDSREQEVQGVRDMSLVENLRQARAWVDTYNLKYNDVVTSRLHCYLPARSVGSKVTFLPKNPSDNRFGGLYDLPDEAFDSMRQGILDKLQAMLTLIASGAPQDEVYAHWRELCAPDVAAAADRLEADAELPVLAPETVDSLVAALTAGLDDGFSSAGADSIDVVVDCRRGDEDHLPTMIASVAGKSSSPLRWTIVADAPSAGQRSAATKAAGGSPVAFLHGKTLAEAGLTGPHARSHRHDVAVSVAPLLSSSSRRAVFLPAASEFDGDIADLARQLPDGAVVAARAERRNGRGSGFDMIRRVANRQKQDHERALRLNFEGTQSVDFDFTPLDANVMVMDLEGARRDNIVGRMAALVAEYGMNYREAAATVVGSGWAELDATYNYSPANELVPGAKVFNWRQGAKPWSELYVPSPSA